MARLAIRAGFLTYLIASACTTLAAGDIFSSVQYQGQSIALTREYEDFHDYKDDPNNLAEESAARVEQLMRGARFGPRFADERALQSALDKLSFPGYGSFYANQLPRRDPTLELVYVEIPRRGRNRYMALEKQPDGSLQVVDDFVAPATPEIIQVHRSQSRLEYKGTDGRAIAPRRE